MEAEMRRALCRIWGSLSTEHEEFYLLGYNAMESVEIQPIFWRNQKVLYPKR
jgi:hypothetical protein